ncbi:hypothetical protein [Methanobrevibacter filiformis]|uniref:Uncharacterized protein n=1 Tax=Methanobrevibacter filiformis TaxID=55758 RepID=A0A166BF46_9EURY|nr:hypothetical protein [Methanobrevibacter filiformis]KZX13262.1 hypothetical protein MBFIL_10550 [Methanobrevibacter filiformis]
MFKKVGPTYVKVTTKYVLTTGRCSCGKTGSYKYYTSKFKNYCPYSKKTGVLKFEQNPTCPEGMWVCTRCDADFCLVTGKEHVKYRAKYLKK